MNKINGGLLKLKRMDTEGVYDLLRSVAELNNMANKGYYYLNVDEKLVNDKIYSLKERAVNKIAQELYNRDEYVGFDYNGVEKFDIVYFRDKQGRQISFHQYVTPEYVSDFTPIWDGITESWKDENIKFASKKNAELEKKKHIISKKVREEYFKEIKDSEDELERDINNAGEDVRLIMKFGTARALSQTSIFSDKFPDIAEQRKQLENRQRDVNKELGYLQTFILKKESVLSRSSKQDTIEKLKSEIEKIETERTELRTESRLIENKLNGIERVVSLKWRGLPEVKKATELAERQFSLRQKHFLAERDIVEKMKSATREINDKYGDNVNEEIEKNIRVKAERDEAQQENKKLEELVTLLKKTGFADVKTGEDFYNALAEIGGSEHYLRPNGTVLGFVKGNTIYLNPDEVSLNTPIHEFGHLWVSQVKGHFPDLWAKGKELFLESDYLRKVQADPNYQHLDLDGQIDEAMARAIGDRGEQELDKTLLEKILDWIAEVWDKIGGVFGINNLTSEQISNLTLQDFTDMATSELLSGENLTERVSSEKPRIIRDIDEEHKVIDLNSPNITQKDIKELNKWLKVNRNEYVRLYHGTGENNDILGKGIKRTSLKRSKSYQSQSGYVYLSRYPNMARSFGEINNMSDTQVYAVDIKIKDLLPDLDQLNNQRAAGKEIGNTLAESLIYGDGARIKRDIMPYEISSTRYNTADETADIKAKAISDGTFMKAPNGKDTNLTERQWLQVRTKAFKKWFGDWEKTARIEKLKKTKPIEITGEEYKGKYELNVKSGHKWILDNLRGTYTIKDTGEKVNLSRVSANEITSHGEREDIHLKSFAVIPQMIENAIFIDETDNYKSNNKYDKYKYYVVGLNVDGVPYTARIVVGEKNGKTYYDHELTQIEKGTIIDSLNGTTTSVAKNANAFSEYKDNRLFSLLQTNSSKVVDKNGEPMVVYHGTNKFGFTVFDKEFSDDKTSIFFTDRVDIAKGYAGVNADVRSLYDDDTAGGYSKDEMLSMLFADVDISSHTNGWDVANDILPYITEDIGITAEYDDEDGVLTLSSDYTGDTYRLTDEEFSWEKVENWLRDNADLENVIDKNAGIYGVFVNARNVLDIDAGGSMWSYIPKKKVKGAEGVGNMNTRDIVEHAKKLNYDGVYIKDLLDTGGRGYGLVGDIEGDIFISLVDKNQIKSATDNIGTFDGEDGDIRYMLVDVQDEKAIDEERRRPKFEIKGEDVYTTMYTTRADTETEIDVLYNGNDFEKALSKAEGYNEDSDREDLTVSVEAVRLKIPVAAIKEEYDYDNEEYDGDVAPFVEDYIDDFVEDVEYDRYETGRDMFDVYKSKPDTDEHELIGTITDKLQQQTGLYIGKYSTFYITKNGEITDEEADKDGVPNAFVSMRIADHTHNRQNGDDTLNIVIADKDPTKTKFQTSKEDLRYTTKDNAEEIVKDILDFLRQYAREYFGDVSEQFNSDLDRFKRNRLLSNYKFNLGIPSPILKAAGLNASNIQMSQSVLDKYLDKHNLKVDDLTGLVDAIRTPIMVYEWGDKARNSVIVTSIPRGEERITTTIHLTRDGNKLNVNEISSIYGKSAERLIRDINTPKSEFGKDNLRYVDKKQVLDWFAMEAPKASSQTQQELITATKVIENFENPPINEKKVVDDTTNDMVRYSIRANDQLDREDEIMGKKAAEIYEARDDEGRFDKVAIHWDWCREFTQLRKWRKTDIDFIHLYNPNPAVIQQQVDSVGGWAHYKGQVYYFSNEGDRTYPLPIFESTLTDMSTEEGISNISYRNARKSFLSAGMLIDRRNADQTAEQENATEKSLLEFQGDAEAGKIMYVEVNSDDEIPQFVPFAVNNFDKDFEATRKAVRESIGISFNQPPILRSEDVGGNFGADLMNNAYNYYNSVTEKERMAIERVFADIFSHWHKETTNNYGIMPLKYQ